MLTAVQENVTIALNGVLSTALRLPSGNYVSGIISPLLTTSTALIFQVSTDGVTYYPLYDGLGARYSVITDPATAEAIAVDPGKFYPWVYVKVEVADAQAGARTIGLVVREY